MPTIKLPYKGKDISINQEGDNATIEFGDMKFEAYLHHGNLDMWHCKDAYFASPDIRELAKHFVDYEYIFKDPNTAPPMAEDAESMEGHAMGHMGTTGHQHTESSGAPRKKTRPARKNKQ